MVSGYLEDDIFTPPPAIARAMATANVQAAASKANNGAESRVSAQSGRLSAADKSGGFPKNGMDGEKVRSVTLDPEIVKLANQET